MVLPRPIRFPKNAVWASGEPGSSALMMYEPNHFLMRLHGMKNGRHGVTYLKLHYVSNTEIRSLRAAVLRAETQSSFGRRTLDRDLCWPR